MPIVPSAADVQQAFSPTRPWVLGVNYQSISYCGVGLCDPILANSVRGPEPFSYDTGLFPFVMAATTVSTSTGGPLAANTDGDDLTATGGSNMTLFQAGVGDPVVIASGTVGASAAWYNKTISDTDTFKAGSPVDRGNLMMVSGISVEVNDPFQRGGTNVAAADPQFYSSWLEMQEDGPGYSQRIQKHLLNNLGITITFGDTGQSFRLGVPSFHPPYGGPAGSQTTRNGQTSTPGTYLPLMTAFCIGAQDEVRQLSLQLTLGQNVTIQADATNTPIAGSTTTGIINTANVGTVYAPVRVSLYGKTVCAPPGGACGLTALDVSSLTPDALAQLKAMLGTIPG